MALLNIFSVFVRHRWVKDLISSLLTVLILLFLTLSSGELDVVSAIAFIWIGSSFWLITSGVLTLLGAYALPPHDTTSGPWKLTAASHLVLGTVLLILGVMALSFLEK